MARRRAETRPLAVIRSLFAAHGVEGEIRDDWLLFGADRPSIHAGWSGDPQRSVQLDIDVLLPNGNAITESFGGLGSSALAHALTKFAEGDLHVLLRVFFDRRGKVDDQCRVSRESLAGEDWTIVSGPLLQEVYDGGRVDRRVVEPPAELLRAMLDAASDRVTGEVCWARCFRADSQRRAPLTEALVCNEDSPEGRTRIQALTWPLEGELTSNRLFLIGVPAKRAARWNRPIPQVVDSVEDCVRAFADRAANTTTTEAVGRRILEMQGAARTLASRVVTFVPSAFARVAFERFTYAPDYVLLDDRAREVGTRVIADEPAFVAATALAREWVEAGGRAEVEAVARTSAEVAVVEQFRQRGEVPDDLEFVPLRIFASAIGETVGRRPWWRRFSP